MRSPDQDRVDELAALLLNAHGLNAQALDRGRRAAAISGERLDRTLNKLGLAGDEAVTSAWAQVTGLGVLSAADYPSQPVLADVLPTPFLVNASVLPVSVRDGTLTLAVLDPLDAHAPRAIAMKTGLTVQTMLARPGDLEQAFKRLYPTDAAEENDPGHVGSNEGLSLDVERLRDLASDAPVIRFVNGLVDRAVELGASDVHLTTTRNGTRARFRIDGMLRDVDPPSPQYYSAVVSRVKIMAGLDIAERRLPQDGRLKIARRGREVDLRVSTTPHLNGEGLVLRILDRSTVALEFSALGLEPATVAALKAVLTEPHGIFLITGPTGSGKTTTLYTCLKTIVRAGINIVTVEEPIEYQLEGVSQIQVDRKIGLDFAGALRSVLRQDPDVIMVGEIRDAETAAIANQAALTGHLVLATLHTNSALASLPRLIDMGVEPYLLASTIRAVMAQRLVRRLCAHCRKLAPNEAVPPTTALLRRTPAQAYRAVGCSECENTGFRGRLAISELFVVSQNARTLIASGASEGELSSCATGEGMQTMSDNIVRAIEQGLTTADEAMRVFGAESAEV